MAPTQTLTVSPAAESATGTSDSVPVVSARILKKRETDRKCQRMIRERTKSRITYLEGIVEEFRRQDASGRVETLMSQLSQMKDERDAMAKKVKTIETIITNDSFKEEPGSIEVSLTHVLPETGGRIRSLSIDTPHEVNHYPPAPIVPASNSREEPFYAVHNKEYNEYIESSSRSSWASATVRPGPDHICECYTNSSALDPMQPLNRWRYANDTLTEWFKWSPQALDMSKFAPYNEDVPVRAVVEGWEAVEKFGHMHPAWRLLRGIDEHLFSTCEPRERLAILTVMGLLLQAHLNPTTEQHRKLPSFYFKRPSQDMLHSYATEYFAWPGLRERFVFSEHRYCSNIFWHLFCRNMRVQWQYEFRDCYVRNTETGLYKISPTFNERINDIRSWTMGMEMFQKYPELYSDIPAWNHIPASISPFPINPGQSSNAVSVSPATSTGRIGRASKPSRERVLARAQSQQQLQVQIPRSDTALITQPNTPYSQYLPASTNSSFEFSTTPLALYDYQVPGSIAALAPMQQVPAMTDWGHNQNLDTYHMNTS